MFVLQPWENGVKNLRISLLAKVACVQRTAMQTGKHVL